MLQGYIVVSAPFTVKVSRHQDVIEIILNYKQEPFLGSS